MRKRIYLIILSVCISVSALFLLNMERSLEVPPIGYTEPAGTGFTESCVYWCVGYGTHDCKCMPDTVGSCVPNQNGANGEDVTISFDIPVKPWPWESTICVRYAVATRDAEGNRGQLVFPDDDGGWVFIDDGMKR